MVQRRSRRRSKVKIAFHVEGPSDFSILRTLVSRILNEEIEAMQYVRRSGGIDAVKSTIENAVKYAWFQNAHGIIIVVDNDYNPTHTSDHEHTSDPRCRYCLLHRLIPNLPATPRSISPLKFGLGIAVQAIEAWLLFGARLVNRKYEQQPELIRKEILKQRVYGSRVWKEEISKPIAEGMDLQALAVAAPSFRLFRDSVLNFKTPLNPQVAG